MVLLPITTAHVFIPIFFYFFPAITCPPPPSPLPGMTMQSDAVAYEYNVNVTYTCGEYALFVTPNGTEVETQVAHCQWDKTWSVTNLYPCKRT